MAFNSAVISNTGTYNARAVTATDDVTWTARTTPAGAGAYTTNYWDICYAPALGRFCAISTNAGDNNNGIITSDDGGVTWTGRSNGPAGGLQAICWSPAKALFVAVGNNVIWTSPDGITWTSRTCPQNSVWAGVAWSPALGLFAAVAQAGTSQVMTSPDGINWTLRTHATAACNSIAWDATAGMFCAIGASAGHVQTSTNGTTWTDHDGSAGLSTYTYVRICSDNLGNFLVAGGNAGQVAKGNGTTTWTRTNNAGSTFNNGQGCCWDPNNSLWIFTADNKVVTSPDGTTWTARTVPVQNWTQPAVQIFYPKPLAQSMVLG